MTSADRAIIVYCREARNSLRGVAYSAAWTERHDRSGVDTRSDRLTGAVDDRIVVVRDGREVGSGEDRAELDGLFGISGRGSARPWRCPRISRAPPAKRFRPSRTSLEHEVERGLGHPSESGEAARLDNLADACLTCLGPKGEPDLLGQ
jgi:hypothetical protein